MRVDFVKALTHVLRKDQQGMLITGDLGFMAFEELSSLLSERFVNAGIAEQNMMGVAAGAALTGLRPWVYSIAPFATYRCLEQIRNDICLHDLPVRITGNGGGYTYGVMGSTHHALEDLAVLKSLPNMQLFFPCSNDHVARAVDAMALLPGPAYLRLGISAFNTDWPVLEQQPETLTRQYAAGATAAAAAGRRRLTIVGAGQGVQVALSALRHLGLAEAAVDVFGVARYPWDFDKDSALRASIETTGNVLFVEEHYGPGGMGESFCAALPSFATFKLLCARYQRGQRYGSPRFHMQQCNLTPDALHAAAQEILRGQS
jgi:transketolase